MYNIPNTIGPVGYGEASGEDGSSSEPFTGEAVNKDLIRRAKTVPIDLIFKYYKLPLNIYNHKIVCPFKSHSGGRERSASFIYYSDTNSYCCFGCRIGSTGVDFVAEMDGITKEKAAYKIISIFDKDIDTYEVLDIEDQSKRLEIMLDFSYAVREFRQSFCDDAAFEHIEYICSVFDHINLKHEKLDNNSLKLLIDNLKKDIINYNG